MKQKTKIFNNLLIKFLISFNEIHRSQQIN